MSDWYQKSGTPAQNSLGSSSAVRAEFALIETAMAKLPTYTGNNSQALMVNSGGTALESVSNATFKTRLGLTVGSDVQAYDAGLQSISGLTTSADEMIYLTGTDTYAVTGLTAAGRAILDDADASAQRTTLGLAIGSDVQAYDDGLNSIAGLTTAADRMIYTTAADTYAVTTLTAAGRALIDDASASAQRTTLGLGTSSSVEFGQLTIDNVNINGSTVSRPSGELVLDGTSGVAMRHNGTDKIVSQSYGAFIDGNLNIDPDAGRPGIFIDSIGSGDGDIVFDNGTSFTLGRGSASAITASVMHITSNDRMVVGTGQTSSLTDSSHSFVAVNGTEAGIGVYTPTSTTTQNVFNVFSNLSANPVMTVEADGDCKNVNGTYTTLSDIRLKNEDSIVEANSQWEDLKAIRFVKYKLLRYEELYGEDAPEHLGTVADWLIEDGMPGLVKVPEDPDAMKSVKQSIIYMKGMVCLQEAQARIEQLEAKVAILEAA